MSLLASTNSGAAGAPYFIENIGLPAPQVPCIAGNTVGAVRVGDPETGLVLRGDRGGISNFIRGGANAGSILNIGASNTSYDNVVLTDGLTTINTSVQMLQPGSSLVLDGDLAIGGELTFTRGNQGESISGYYNALVPVNVVNPVNAVPNPVGLTAGWYLIGLSQPTSLVNNGSKMPGCIGHFNGALWDAGGFGGDVSVVYICPNDAHTELQIVSGVALPSTVVSFAKMMN